MNQYQLSTAGQGFQAELPNVPVSTKSESSVVKFFKGLVKVILIIGAIILMLPVAVVITCLIIFGLGGYRRNITSYECYWCWNNFTYGIYNY